MLLQVEENLWQDYFHPTSPHHLPPELRHSLLQAQNPLNHSATRVCPRPQFPPHTPKIPSVTPDLLKHRTGLKLQLRPKISFLYLHLLNASVTLLTSPLSLSHSPRTFSCVYFKSTSRWTFMRTSFCQSVCHYQIAGGAGEHFGKYCGAQITGRGRPRPSSQGSGSYHCN